jgi:hypothetical protein
MLPIDTVVNNGVLFSARGKRSPREATCPSIASCSPRAQHVFLQIHTSDKPIRLNGTTSAPVLIGFRMVTIAPPMLATHATEQRKEKDHVDSKPSLHGA